MVVQQNKFAFFANFAETIKTLPEEKQALAYKALCEYGIYGVLPEDETLRMMCLMSKASIYKEDGRKNNGGNHNPEGKNQHTKQDNLGQSRTKLDKVGQTLSETETETETETEECIRKIDLKNDKGVFSPPTLEDVLVYAKKMNDTRGIGGFACSKNTAVAFFTHYDRQGWLLGNGIHMVKWQSALMRWANEEERKVMER